MHGHMNVKNKWYDANPAKDRSSSLPLKYDTQIKTLHPCTQLFCFFVEIYKITNTRENIEWTKRKERHMTANSVLFCCSSNCIEMRKAKIVYSPLLWLSAASLRVTTVKNLNLLQKLVRSVNFR
jgi:hypothetical protein